MYVELIILISSKLDYISLYPFLSFDNNPFKGLKKIALINAHVNCSLKTIFSFICPGSYSFVGTNFDSIFSRFTMKKYMTF